jgi:tRNA threonylcarbamoyladenosine biosynthesis protein TsaE
VVVDEALTLVSHNLAETQDLGSVLGRMLNGQEVICLEGELGTGKTSLIQAIGRALGVTAPITSPTFTLVNEYGGRDVTIYHVDLYRLHGAEEIVQAGIDGCFYSHGICLVEWAEKARALLPAEYLYITLQHAGGDRRHITVHARGDSYRKLLVRLTDAVGSRT